MVLGKFFLVCAFALVTMANSETATEATVETTTGTPQVDFTGRYKMTISDSDNYNELLKKLDIGYFKRLIATKSSSEYNIAYDNTTKQYTLQTLTTFSSALIKFQSGVEFDEERADGQTVKSTITVDGNTWTQVQIGTGPTVNIVRTWNGNVIDVITTCDGIKMVRKYEKQ